MGAAFVDDGLKAGDAIELSTPTSTIPDYERRDEGVKDDNNPEDAKPRPERTATFNDYLVCRVHVNGNFDQSINRGFFFFNFRGYSSTRRNGISLLTQLAFLPLSALASHCH